MTDCKINLVLSRVCELGTKSCEVHHGKSYRSPACWVAGPSRNCTTTKTIEYECGCKITLRDFGPTEAGHACDKHAEPIKRVTTIDEFF